MGMWQTSGRIDGCVIPHLAELIINSVPEAALEKKVANYWHENYD